MTPIVWTYFTYLLISVSLTVWVAKTLHKNGRIFLVYTFRGNEPLAPKVQYAYSENVRRRQPQPAD